MSDKAYIVYGSCGTHSDWHCWIVASFSNKPNADEYVKTLKGQADRKFCEDWGPWYGVVEVPALDVFWKHTIEPLEDEKERGRL